MNSDELSRLRREFAEHGLFNFHQTYFRHHIKVPSGQFHVNLCSWLDAALLPGGRLIGACPREHAKTTLGTTVLGVMCAATGKKSHIVVVGANIQQAKLKKANITMELETNALLRADYGDSILPAIDAKGQYVRNNDTETILNNGCRILAMEIGSKGIRGQNYQGKRPDLLILDDPESDDKVLEPGWRHKMWDWIFGASINSLEQGGSIIWLGTILHFDALLNRAMLDNEQCAKWRRFQIPASFNDAGEFWHDPRANILWPEAWPFERLDARRDEIGGYRYAREFGNQPLDPSTQVFKPAWWKWYDQANLREIGGIWYYHDGTNHPLAVYIGVDPAIGDDKIKRRDFFAYCVLGRDPLNRIFVLEVAQLKGLSFEEGKQTVYRSADRWRPGVIVIEAESYQAALSQQVWEAGYPVKEVKHRTNKSSRIESAATHVEGLGSGGGRVYLPQGTPSQEFLEQATQWPASKNDDMLDAFTMALTEAVCRDSAGSSIAFAGATRTTHKLMEGF